MPRIPRARTILSVAICLLTVPSLALADDLVSQDTVDEKVDEKDVVDDGTEDDGTEDDGTEDDDNDIQTYTNLVALAKAYENGRVVSPVPVDIEATVTCWDLDWKIVFVQDDGVGFHVQVDWERVPQDEVPLGSRVRVQGVTIPGVHTIDKAVVTLVSPGKLPDPEFISISETQWEHTSSYVQTEGVVEQIAVLEESKSYLLTLRNGGTDFVIRLRIPLNDTLIYRMLGARLRIRGVLAAVTDSTGRIRIHLCHVVDPASLHFLDESKRAPVVYRKLRDHETNEISSDPRWSGELVDFQAQVASRRDDEFVTLDDGNVSLRLTTVLTEFLAVGTVLDVQGRVAGYGDSVRVEGEVLRIVGERALPTPKRLSAGEIVKSRSMWRRVSVAGRLDRIKHRLGGGRELVLTDGGVRYRAVFSATDGEVQALKLDTADIVRCTGIVNFADRGRDTKFTLYTDVESLVVESRQPDSSLTKAAVVILGILGSAFLSMIVWRNWPSSAASTREEIAPLVSAFDAVHEGILIFDEAGRLAHFNNRIKEVLEVDCRPGDDALTTFGRISEYLNDDIVFRTAWQEFAHHSLTRSTVDMQANTRDGRCLAIFSAPIADKSGDIAGRIWRFDDVSEKLDLEERLVQSQKMEAVGRLAGGIAHDFNNLLMGITTNLDFARKRAAAQTEGRGGGNLSYIKEAVAASDRAADLVAHLLEFSRKSPLDRRRSSLNSVVERVVKLLERSFDSTIELSAQLSPDLGSCEIDTVQIEQVLINLCINARDSLPNVGGHIRITTCNNSDGGDYVQLSVEDNGHGMSGETRAKIFEPFFTTKEVGKGTGLGLAMSYGIVKQHGGQIECISSPNEGTRIDVFIPRTGVDRGLPSQNLRESTEAESTEAEIEKSGDGCVLLADDDDIVRASLETMLSSRGYEVTAVANGQDAIDALEAGGQFQVAILDGTMPVLSGYDAFKVIADRHSNVPVVILSGYVCDVDELKDASGRAPDAVLTKPCSADRLIAVLERLRQEYIR